MNNRLLIALLITGSLSACGDGVIRFGGNVKDDGGGDDITIHGNIIEVIAENGRREVVVFVYTNAVSGAELPYSSDEFESVRTVIVGCCAGETFSISNIRRGTLTVVFLQDLSTDPDGAIDDEDVALGPPVDADTNAVAELINAGVLNNSDVKGGSTVDVSDLSINFTTGEADPEGEITISIDLPRNQN